MSHCVLFTVEHLYPLGPAQLLFPLAKGMVAAGHDVVVAVLGRRTTDVDRWVEAGVRVFFVNADDRTPLHTYRDSLSVVSELRRLIRLIAPNSIHAWCGETIWLTLLATQPLPWLRQLPSYRLFATELNLHPEKTFFRSLVEDNISHRIDTLVVPHVSISDDLADEGIVAQNTVVVPNGIRWDAPFATDSASLADRESSGRQRLRQQLRQTLGLPPNARLAVAVADLLPRTRLKDLVWATDLLACIRDDFHFAVIGTGPQLWRLRRFAGQTEAKKHVHFLGVPDSPDTYLAAADFFWHAHLQSPQPGPLLAAMAMAVPAICVLGPGTEDIVKHQATGFAVNFGARDEFARWTKFLIEQTEPAEQLARQGQEYVLEHYPFESMLTGYLSLYD